MQHGVALCKLHAEMSRMLLAHFIFGQMESERIRNILTLRICPTMPN